MCLGSRPGYPHLRSGLPGLSAESWYLVMQVRSVGCVPCLKIKHPTSKLMLGISTRCLGTLRSKDVEEPPCRPDLSFTPIRCSELTTGGASALDFIKQGPFGKIRCESPCALAISVWSRLLPTWLLGVSDAVERWGLGAEGLALLIPVADTLRRERTSSDPLLRNHTYPDSSRTIR